MLPGTFPRVSTGTHFGFIDESSVSRSRGRQDYLVCAAVVAEEEVDSMRDGLRPLLRRGQIKVHWSDEGPASRQTIVERLAQLSPMSVVVSHASQPQRTTERFRRKCLERLYYEMASMEVDDLTLEGRTPAQNKKDFAHVVALQNQGLPRALRIGHRRGGDEPLLWIADVVLGAINASYNGEPKYLKVLEDTILLRTFTADSLDTGERP